MEKVKNKKMWSVIALVFIGFVMVATIFNQSSSISAKTDESSKKVTQSKTQDIPNLDSQDNQNGIHENNFSSRLMNPIENESGLKATAKILTVAQNKAFPSLATVAGRNMLFSQVVIPDPQAGASYVYVDSEGSLSNPSSSAVGFQKIYVKITENATSSSIIVPIPVTVTDAGTSLLFSNTVALQVNNTSGKIILYPNDTKGKNATELSQLVQSKGNIQAWNMETGEAVPVNVLNTTINATTIGAYTANVEVTAGSGADQQKVTTSKAVVVFGAEPQKYVNVTQNTPLVLSTVPTNLFTKFQTVTTTISTGVNYKFVDEEGKELLNSKFDTSEVGFHWANIKMTDNNNPNISTVIKVAVNVTNDTISTHFGATVMLKKDKDAVVTLSDIKGKNSAEVAAIVQAKMNLKAWNISTGETVAAKVTSTTVKPNTIGNYSSTIQLSLAGKTETTYSSFVVFGAMLKAPYYTAISQFRTLDMGLYAGKFFDKYQTLTGNLGGNANYEWVANEAGDPIESFDSSKAGFQWGYIKMSEKTNASISTVIPVPITVTNNQTTIVNAKAGLSYDLPLVTKGELKNLDNIQIIQLLTNKLSLSAWALTSGKKLDVKVTGTTITPLSQTGEITVTITSETEIIPYKLNILVVPDKVFGKDLSNDWKNIPLNSSEGLVINPLTGSKMSFPQRGLTSALKTDQGFIIKDEQNRGYVFFDQKVSDIPGVGSYPLYGGSVGWSRTNGLGWDEVDSRIVTSYFMRKGNTIKQILFDQKNQVMYVYTLSLARNLNFSVYLDMYNLSNETKKFSMLESVDTDYLSDLVSIYAMGNNSGFYMEKEQDVNNKPVKRRFSIKLKDSKGQWLSDYTKFIAGAYKGIGVFNDYNYFGNDFSKSGNESDELAEGDVISENVDTAYQLGAPWKDIASGESLKTGYEVFVGQELPYMQLQADPDVFNIYQDHTEDLVSDYTISKIPEAGAKGSVYVTYPDGSENQLPYLSNEVKEFDGRLVIPVNKLSDNLNEEQGTIKSYDTSLIAVDESGGPTNGVPSHDYQIKVNVYHLGGSPIAQILKKDSVWNKEANTLIADPVILPGHKADFEYVNPSKPVDTSKPGLQYMEVRMTDMNDPSQKTIIRVPVMVLDDTLPTTGVMVGAVDFGTNRKEVSGLSDEELNALILKKSDAAGWDIATGLQKDVELSVLNTTLTNDPDITKKYTATIQAKKGAVTETTTVQITLSAKLIVNFLDIKGNAIHDPYTGTNEIGSTVDLTELSEVTDILAKLKADNYELVKKPDNEQFKIVYGENRADYQFNGALTLISAPDVLDFETKNATVNAVKFTDPKVVGKPLVVSDTRAEKEEWSLKANVDQPLTSLANKEVIIPDAIKYNYQGEDLMLGTDSVVIVNHTNTASDTYDITKERWSKGEGFLLDLQPGAIKALGKYQAKITITLENTK
ncbi:hypothetical protein A5821_002194 [Enterococcus sp. 7F3_DIV0205]|uniref:Uncharacterized protein n=1 Tax=Candidatus Enterococcus palustris TaxID=1834189 RepID=A0AAQ3W9H8_9ENTE|nr:hypothetical protein [Enterococcus sp. 7F3_DIV0205]OTN82633.1 hypothetical protein A5821_002544 [Enterococcus sp. 7F3_DIV0205]